MQKDREIKHRISIGSLIVIRSTLFQINKIVIGFGFVHIGLFIAHINKNLQVIVANLELSLTDDNRSNYLLDQLSGAIRY